MSAAQGEGLPIPGDWIPPLPAVAGFRLVLSPPAGPGGAPQPLYATHPDHRPVIALVLDRLVGSRLTAGPAEPSAAGGVLHVALRRGGRLAVEPAGECPDAAGPGERGYVCPPSPSDVVLRLSDGRAVRVRNPWMAGWLQEGWRAHLPVGAPQLLDRDAAVALAREQSGLPAWQARFVDAYPVERSGGTEVRPAWLLEAELPAGQRIRLVLDAQTGEVLRLVQLEALP
ncbi:hypothetical protein [Symbiobacterium thermophilum]|uniref:hypothetical protein n=1 Tax=Symbiobacterium thermophilum TaxID=2734 RepID=UPI0035C6DB17